MFDVLIIGAGVSGLTTAYKILQKEPSLKLQILEADDKIGGQIACSPENKELGGRLIIPEQWHIYNLLNELGINMRRRAPISKNLQRSWSLDVGKFAPLAKFELQRYMNYLDLKSQLYRPGSYELTPEDKQYTMCKDINSCLLFQSSRTFMRNFVRLIAGVDSRDISFIEFMNIVHSCGDLKTLYKLFIEPSQKVLEFSAEQLIGTFESKLEEVTINKLSKVVEISHFGDYVQVTDINGNNHTAKVAVLAIPCNYIEDIFISPPVPEHWEIPSAGEKYYITSFKVDYTEPHWRRQGFSGNYYSSDPIIFAQQYKQTSLIGYILHGQGFEVLTKSIVLKNLSESFGSEMAVPNKYIQETYEQTALLNLPYTTPWNRIIWSSNSTATIYRGCLNGAVQSGLRAAIHVLLTLRPQSVVWQDLAEVQKASVVYRYPSHWSIIKSSINVFNTLKYTSMGLLVFLLFKYRL